MDDFKREMLVSLLEKVQDCPEHSHSDIDITVKQQMALITPDSKKSEVLKVLDYAAYNAACSDFGMILLDLIYQDLDD